MALFGRKIEKTALISTRKADRKLPAWTAASYFCCRHRRRAKIARTLGPLAASENQCEVSNG
jgi:hypothetical protein